MDVIYISIEKIFNDIIVGGVKMSKRFIALLLVVALMVTVFVGCSQEPKENASVNQGNKEDVVVTEVDAVDVKKVFVSPEWVKSVIDGAQEESQKYIILEASIGKLNQSSDYNNGHVPGAYYANIKDVEDSIYWNIKSPEKMEKAILDLGITKDTVVILYGSDISGVARMAYAYIWAGVENVKILDGGINAWTNAGYELETTANVPTPATEFGATIPAHPEFWTSVEDVQENLKDNENFRLVSIRSYDEFIGETSGYSYIAKAGEPEGATWGKGSILMDEYTHEDGTVITLEELQELWNDVNFTLDNELAFYCGTGWRASVPFLIMYENGFTNMSIYDGGWYRWQMDNDLPVQVGDPATEDVVYTTVGELPNDKAAK